MSDDEYDALHAQFTTLFTPPLADHSAKILSIIQSTPSVDCAEALAISFLSAALSNPEAIDALVAQVAHIQPKAKDIIVTDEEVGYTNTPFSSLIDIHLSDVLGNELHELQLNKPKQTAVIPLNRVLAAAVLSGCALKNGILSTSTIYAFARQGLRLPDERSEEERKEVVALGTCLQLLVAGKTMVEKALRWNIGLEKIVAALEALKEDKVIQYPTGVELLETTISVSKTGFSNSLTPSEAWKTLFPSS